MKPRIKVNFVDFWPRFVAEEWYFYRLLSERYEVEISSKPDFLFYSVFGTEFRKYDCVRIFYTGENVHPNFAQCDWAFSFDHLPENPRHYRLPVYAWYLSNSPRLTEPKDPAKILAEKDRFCNFVYSNERAQVRQEFFHKLSKYKRVDSAGKVLNNLGYPVDDKTEFLSHYKFTIAFENESAPGYTTEKLVDPMHVHSLPIYWGNPLVDRDFNTKSFINCHDYPDFDAVIERIIEADRDDAVYAEYLAEPYFVNNTPNEFVRTENVLRQLDRIITTPIKPVGATVGHRLWTYGRRVKAFLRQRAPR